MPWKMPKATGSRRLSGLADLCTEMPLPVPAPAEPTVDEPLTPTVATPAEEPRSMIVQASVTPYGGLKVRTARHVEANYIEALPAGASVTVLEGPLTEGGETWICIRAASGNEGWARSCSGDVNYLEPVS